MNKPVPVLYQDKQECCGCTACYAICPAGAIKMEEDQEGFDYPMIDGQHCIRCGMCLAVCPLKKGN